MRHTLPLNCHRINKSQPLLLGFIWFLLNNCMNKRDFEYAQARIAQRDTNLTNRWLKAEGISPNCFANTDVKLLKAQQTAHHCLAHHGALLTSAERDALTQFIKASHNRKARPCLSDKRIYQVLNIGNRINRQLFKQHRHIQA